MSTCSNLMLRSKPVQRSYQHFLRFKTEERVLRVNKSKIIDKKIFNGDYFGIEGNHGSNKHENVLFWIFLQICD